MSEYNPLDNHERFKELGALARTGVLSKEEWGQLKAHLSACKLCRETCAQYERINREAMPMLAGDYGYVKEHVSWPDDTVRRKLFARVQKAEQRASLRSLFQILPINGALAAPWAIRLIAACLVVAVAIGVYRFTARNQAEITQAASPDSARLQELLAEKESTDKIRQVQLNRITLLEQEESRKAQELSRLRSQLDALEVHSTQIAAAKGQLEDQVRHVLQERDVLNSQLREVEQAYQDIHTELASLRTERDEAQQRATLYLSKIDELTTANQEKERRLKDNEQYLASDRDIRELMGARKLYIADVFDVDSGSRKRSPFGRVFYTQNKSLIFYAFDLDRQPGFKNASTFQVWGQREMAQGERTHPMNLGILYMDSESNRRWVMRFDDPKQLAEIDAVFVTVEPRGGSQKPTSKPFLYALLRKEANHP